MCTEQEKEVRIVIPKLINVAKVKRTVLEEAGKMKKMSDGKPRYTRVSKDYIENFEARVRTMVVNDVQRLPSSGHTI